MGYHATKCIPEISAFVRLFPPLSAKFRPKFRPFFCFILVIPMNLFECFEFSSPVVGSNLQTGKQHRFCYDDPPSAHNKLKLVLKLVKNLI